MTNATNQVQDWVSFYTQIGVDQKALTGRHADCPLCKNEACFRTNIPKRPGVYVCSKCTSSKYTTPLDFVKRFMDFDSYQEAAMFIYDRCSNGVKSPERKTQVLDSLELSADQFAKETAKRQWVWNTLAVPVSEGDPVWKYLHRRIPGLKRVPQNIRYQPKAQYWEKGDNGPVLMGEFPAMIVRGFNSKGQCVQLHTTFLTDDGKKAEVTNPKKVRTSIGSNSFAMRLSDIGDDGVLGLSEGIETGLAAENRFGHAVWACHSNTVLANFEVPEDLIDKISKLIIYADNDGWRLRQDGTRWNPGVSKARELAEKLRAQRQSSGKRLNVLVAYTSSIGDFAD